MGIKDRDYMRRGEVEDGPLEEPPLSPRRRALRVLGWASLLLIALALVAVALFVKRER